MPRIPDLPCASCGKMMWRGTTSLPEGQAMCNPCRRASHEHGTRQRYRGGCRCQQCRDAQAAEVREYRASRAAKGKPLPRYGTGKHVVPCSVCERPVEKYYAARSRRSVCSDRCRYFLRWGKFPPSKELVHVGPKEPVAPPVPTTIVSMPKWWRVMVSGPCAWCGENFTGTGSATRYCSKRCVRQRQLAQRGKRFVISPIVRRAIYERDGWTCQLCDAPVDPAADHLSDWYPSLDHVIPQSHALIPDHSPENLRTAHRWCNAVRGDGTYHADLFEEAS